MNVRDMFIPKALGGTAKGADVKSHKFKQCNLNNNMPKNHSKNRIIEKQNNENN